MTPDTLFQLANPLALGGWVALAFAPLIPRASDLIAGMIIPLMLSLAYAALVLAFWSGADGGFSSLAEVMALFTDPAIALAGWLHYLAFDLFIGAWAVRTARSDGTPHLLVLPHLVLIFLFGPAGFLTFQAMRASLPLKSR